MVRIGWSGETEPAWKSMLWPIEPWLTRVTTNVSPTRPCSAGPGTVPPKVHIRCRTPGATSMSLSTTGSVTACSVPVGAGAKTGSYGVKPPPGVALGSTVASEALPAAAWVPAPDTWIAIVIPAARWPGTVHQASRPVVTTPTDSRCDSPSASRRVCGPSATLRSCRPRSRLVTSRTRFVPAGTSMERGSIVMSPSDTATTWVPPAAREVLAPPAAAPWPRLPTAIAAPSSTMARPTAPATTTARRPEPGPVPAGAEAVGAGGSAAEHHRQQEGERAGEHLADEAHQQHRHQPVERDGHRFHGRRSEHDHHVRHHGDRQPGGARGQQPGRGGVRVPLDGGADQRDQRGDEPGGVQHQSGGGAEGRSGQQRSDGGGEANDCQRQRAVGGILGAFDHAGAQRGRPERELGAEHRQGDPAQHVGVHVGGVQPAVPDSARVAGGQQRAEHDAGEQKDPRGHVEPGDGAEARLQRPAPEPDQAGEVDADDRGDDAGTGGGQHRVVGGHPGEYGEDADVEPHQAQADLTPRGSRRPQQRGGEVLAPGHYRVGDRAEQEQVDGKPARNWQRIAGYDRQCAGSEVGQHDRVCPGVPGGPRVALRRRTQRHGDPAAGGPERWVGGWGVDGWGVGGWGVGGWEQPAALRYDVRTRAVVLHHPTLLVTSVAWRTRPPSNPHTRQYTRQSSNAPAP